MNDDDIRMMRNPSKWPAWPLLPVKSKTKRWGDSDFLGFLMEIEFDKPIKPIVFIGNMLSINDMPLKDRPSKQYDSFEALASEWMVD